jgi:diguanylate cyclase (GGDEF)-like protein
MKAVERIEERPQNWRDAARDFAPFGGAIALAWITVPIASTIEWAQYAIATTLLLVAVISRFVLVRRGHRGGGLRWIFPSLIVLTALGLLRNSAGGISSGVSAVAIVPVFYVALHSEARRDLYALLCALAVYYILPILLVGPPAYPQTQYRAALLSVAVSSIIGLATQRLVGMARLRAEEARTRERMLQQVSSVMRSLFGSPQVRIDVCEAAKMIGEGTAAVLYEPVLGSNVMRASAIVGLDAEEIEISLDRPSAVRDAFRSGRSVLITDGLEQHIASRELWEASGRPSAALYEPLLRGSEPIGVLVVSWIGAVQAGGPGVTVVELLAHEAAAVITRADTLTQLSDMAETDPLTGLPNRRAWDAGVAQLLTEGVEFTVAMLDFDHFKQYNDTYGHPAGDRLLKETAALWREQLRTGDLLARLGGEEFGLLLLGCDAVHASDVIERLRGAVYGDRTCSAGFAVRQPGESSDAVMKRADEALYEAKAAGRDRTRSSAVTA